MSAANLTITKERVKAWSACSDGYRWFLDKFPQGGQFGDVYEALRSDRRYNDSDWLVERVFAELDTESIAQQTVLISGADKDKITAAAQDGGDANAATTGEGANAATTGEGANAATTGHRANAATTGEGANAATTGKHAIAAALGIDGKAKASSGGAIVVCHRNDDGDLIHIRASRVGENGVKPDVWYSLNASGEFVEADQ